MIREAASNIVEIPVLMRSGNYNEQVINQIAIIKNGFRSIPYMIEQFWANVKHIARNSKWIKLILLRHNIPIEIFDIVKPFFFVKHSGNLFFVEPRIPNPIYHIPIRSKLYRMGYIDDTTMPIVEEWFIKKMIPYVTEPWSSYYYYHPHFSRTMFIQRVLLILSHVETLSLLEPLLVMRAWL